MGEQILSQDEIDALLGAMAKGEVELEPEAPKLEAEKKADEKKADIESYDLTSKKLLLQNQFYALEEVNDKLTRNLQDFFTTFFQQSIETKLISNEVVNFENFIQSFSNPTYFQIFTMEPLIGSALLAIEPNLIFSLIDCMFGGDGKALPYERKEFTQLEIRLINKMVIDVLEIFEASWKNVYPVKTEPKKNEVKPEFVHLYNLNDLILSEIISVSGKKFSGNLYFCLSYLMIEPIKELLSAKFLREKEVEHCWEPQIKRLVNDLHINISAELGRKSYSIRELLKMQVGDILSLDNGPNDNITICVENIPKYLGFPGIVKGNRAIQISHPINNFKGERK
jgi:flagellar motor switch protein FliM